MKGKETNVTETNTLDQTQGPQNVILQKISNPEAVGVSPGLGGYFQGTWYRSLGTIICLKYF